MALQNARLFRYSRLHCAGRVATSEETIDLLNTYYTLMFDAISGHGGIVSLIVGDGLMAIFGAPLPHHCESAVRAGLKMIEMVELFNLERIAVDKPEIRIGIDIASGEMVAGYTGTNARATYTCIGNTVNLVSRLEAHTKVTDRPILIDNETRDGLSDRIQVEFLGPIPFKGKAVPVDVCSVGLGQKV